MRVVFIASPFAGATAVNVRYARACMLDSLSRGEAPIVPHLLFPQVLSEKPDDRKLGMRAGASILKRCEGLAVYCDLGISTGMRADMAIAENAGVEVERRMIGESRIDLDPPEPPKPSSEPTNVVDIGAAPEYIAIETVVGEMPDEDPAPEFESELGDEDEPDPGPIIGSV